MFILPKSLAKIMFFSLLSFSIFTLFPAAKAQSLQSQTIRQIQIAAKDLVYDKTRGKIYASVASNDVSYGNHVVIIEPLTGNIETAIFVGSQPNKMALTDNGQYLYVALDGAAAIRRVNLQTNAAELQISLGSSSGEVFFAFDILTIEGMPNSVVVSRRAGSGSSFGGVAVYDDEVMRPVTSSTSSYSSELVAGTSPSTVYGFNTLHSGADFYELRISSVGISVVQPLPRVFTGSSLKISNGKIYSNGGQIYDTTTNLLSGTFSLQTWTNEVYPDASTNRTFFAYYASNDRVEIGAFDSTSLQPKGSILVSGVPNFVRKLERWGYNGLAFCSTDGKTFIVQTPLVPSQPVSSDFDGDRKSDLAVFRPSDSNWYWQSSQNNNVNVSRFGLGNDQPLNADFDGDGKNDLAVYREGVWYWLKSSNGSFQASQFGLSDDLPVPADFDGDGKSDIAVWRPSTAVWYVWNSGNQSVSILKFGLSQDYAVPSDFDGDGRTDIAVFRPSTGDWHVFNLFTNRYSVAHFGSNGDLPFPADFDGDIKSDLAVFRPAESAFYVQNSQNGQIVVKYVPADATMTIGDYDGDGKTDTAFVRNGQWTIYQTQNGKAEQTNFGLSGDKYIANRRSFLQ